MKPDKLECLLKSFIANRIEFDSVDGIHTDVSGNFQAEFDDPLSDLSTQGGNFLFGGAYGAVEAASQTSNVYNVQLTQVGKKLANLAAQFSKSRPDSSPIKFEKSCIVVAPKEQTISIPVIRHDTHKDTVTRVRWETCDKTAISGTHYIGSSGEIVFDKDINKQIIEIKILHSSSDNLDLRFNVEMTVIDGGFDPAPMTVSLKELADFYPNERQVVRNLPLSPPFTVEDINCILRDSLTNRTFHMALTHLCSAADNVHLEFALALDLSRLCMKHLCPESVLNVLQDFFRTEDIDS